MIAYAWDYDLHYPHIRGMAHVVEDGSNESAVIEQLKGTPPGHRVLHVKWLTELCAAQLDDPSNWSNNANHWRDDRAPWMDAGPVAARMLDYCQRIKAAGATVDILVTDFEFPQWFWPWSVNGVKNILSDPRCPLRMDAELICDVNVHRREALQWMQWVNNPIVDACRKAASIPLWRVFPKAKVSDYASCPLQFGERDPNGAFPEWRQERCVGNIGAPSFHPYIAWLQNARVDGVSDAEWTTNPMPTLIHQTNRARAFRRSSKLPMHPWLPFKAFSNSAPIYGTPYWTEMIYHIAGSLWSNVVMYFEWQATNADHQAMEDALAEGTPLRMPLTGYAWSSWPPTIFQEYPRVPCSSPWLVTGHRLTFAPGVESAKVWGKTHKRPADAVGMWI